MVTIICVYNNVEILNGRLIKSLEDQKAEFELITLDNRKGQFKSAAEAFNAGGKKAHGNLLMFVHQDVCLLGNEWLIQAEFFADKCENLGIAGIAGMRYLKKHFFLKVGTVLPESGVGSVFHGSLKEPWNCNREFFSPIEVQTLDELLLIIPKDVFMRLNLDDVTCDNWHLYGVDYSLAVARLGLKSYILPIPVWHLSTGTVNASYFHTLRKILIKHKDSRRIFTTCGFWYTSVIKNILELTLMCAKAEIGKWAGLNNHGLGPYLRLLKMFYAKTGCI